MNLKFYTYIVLSCTSFAGYAMHSESEEHGPKRDRPCQEDHLPTIVWGNKEYEIPYEYHKLESLVVKQSIDDRNKLETECRIMYEPETMLTPEVKFLFDLIKSGADYLMGKKKIGKKNELIYSSDLESSENANRLITFKYFDKMEIRNVFVSGEHIKGIKEIATVSELEKVCVLCSKVEDNKIEDDSGIKDLTRKIARLTIEERKDPIPFIGPVNDPNQPEKFVKTAECILQNFDAKKVSISSNINIMPSFPFKNQLKILYLNNSRIASIENLAHQNFEYLEELCLVYNRISSLEPFGKSRFCELTILDIGVNLVKDMSPFTRMDAKKITEFRGTQVKNYSTTKQNNTFIGSINIFAKYDRGTKKRPITLKSFHYTKSLYRLLYESQLEKKLSKFLKNKADLISD